MKKILAVLLYLFVFLLPLQTRWIVFEPRINNGIWEYGRISIYAFDIVFVFLLFFYFVFLVKKRHFARSAIQVAKIPANYKLLFISLLLFFYLFISVWFVAGQKITAAHWFLRVLQGVLLVWFLARVDFSKIKLAWAFVAGVTLSAILGIYQFLTQSAFASKWLGLAHHSAAVWGASVVETIDGRWLRAYGSFPHPNILAGFIILAIVFCVWLFIKTQNPAKKLFLAICYLLLIIALFFTFSRAAWLAFLLLLVAGLWLLIAKKALTAKTLLYYFITLLLLLLLTLVYLPLAKTRLQGAARLEIRSNTERVSAYYQAWQVFKNRPLVGAGIGNYVYELQKINPGAPAWVYQPVHNVYVLILSELGLVGFFIFVPWVIYFVFYQRQSPDILIFLCFNVILFLCLFDHFWWTLPSGMLVGWLVLGLGAIGRTSRKAPNKYRCL